MGSWCWRPHPSESRAPRRCWGGVDYCRAPRRARQVASCCASRIPSGEQHLAMHSQLRAAHLNHVCTAYLPQNLGCPSPGCAGKAQAFLREGELPGCHREFCNGIPRPFLREQSPGWKRVVHSSQQPIKQPNPGDRKRGKTQLIQQPQEAGERQPRTVLLRAWLWGF